MVEGNNKILAGKWRENYLNCRTCKRSLVIYLGKYFLRQVGKHIQPDQTLYVAGAFTGIIANSAWYVTGAHKPEPDPAFSTNAEETDTRLWLHARRSSCARILILSPDTDIYHIGLSLKWIQQKEILVQISAVNSRQLKLINMQALIQAFCNDPDQAHVDKTHLPQIMQTLYVVSGCDYISFLATLGKQPSLDTTVSMPPLFHLVGNHLLLEPLLMLPWKQT